MHEMLFFQWASFFLLFDMLTYFIFHQLSCADQFSNSGHILQRHFSFEICYQENAVLL